MPETTKHTHTPGPWKADWVNVYREDDHLADCCPKAKNGIPLEQKEANARLIAAAPELLSALQRILEADEMDPRLWDSICGASIAYADAFAAAHAAITKATQG